MAPIQGKHPWCLPAARSTYDWLQVASGCYVAFDSEWVIAEVHLQFSCPNRGPDGLVGTIVILRDKWMDHWDPLGRSHARACEWWHADCQWNDWDVAYGFSQPLSHSGTKLPLFLWAYPIQPVWNPRLLLEDRVHFQWAQVLLTISWQDNWLWELRHRLHHPTAQLVHAPVGLTKSRAHLLLCQRRCCWALYWCHPTDWEIESWAYWWQVQQRNSQHSIHGFFCERLPCWWHSDRWGVE